MTRDMHESHTREQSDFHTPVGARRAGFRWIMQRAVAAVGVRLLQRCLDEADTPPQGSLALTRATTVSCTPPPVSG